MKGIFLDVPEYVLQWRRETGADRFDEMWEGVMHMNLPPSAEHQEFVWSIETWLRTNWMKAGRKVLHQFAVSAIENWMESFRVPDVILIKPGQASMIKGSHFHGPPAVVVEVRGPGDESLEKLDFYAALGVPNVWIVETATKAAAMYQITGGSYERQTANDTGWLASESVGIELRHESNDKLGIRLVGDDGSYACLPDLDVRVK
jgi:hypothetical protein